MSSSAASPPETPSVSTPANGFFAHLEELLERAGEYLNPILVKEARQSLKSMQFVITFTLLMLCGWAWTILALGVAYANLHNTIYYYPLGPVVMGGYCVILVLPMMIVVPFTAFRSLAAEREDGTYELLCITTLTARQIVTGKLGSAVLQMIVYYSALSPCIAFTYLLRGIDIISIMLVLGHGFIISLLLASFALLVATACRSTMWQVLLSILLLIGLLVVAVASAWVAVAYMVEVVQSQTLIDEPEFWMANLSYAMFAVSFIVLFILASAAQLSFESDNRSTSLRICMLGQQLLIFGWWAYVWIRADTEEPLYFLLSFSAVYWMLMGGIMISETGELSPRVRRQLPQTALGRSIFQWFNPGSAVGYMLAIVTTLGICITTFLVAESAWILNLEGYLTFGGGAEDSRIRQFAILTFFYVAAYLGVSRLIVVLIRQKIEVTLFLSFAITFLLSISGAIFPFLVDLVARDFGVPQYGLVHITNWAFTLTECADKGIFGPISFSAAGPPTYNLNGCLIIAGSSLIIFLNVLLGTDEFVEEREATPARVQEDEIELHPQLGPDPNAPQNPWDIEDPETGV